MHQLHGFRAGTSGKEKQIIDLISGDNRLCSRQDETHIEVNVCFAKPGVYNINRFRVVVSTPTISGKIMYCPFQHLITVEKALNDTSEAG